MVTYLQLAKGVIATRSVPAAAITLAASCFAFGQSYTIATFAGGGLPPANILGTSASLFPPGSVAVDGTGNVFFADEHVVLRLDATTGGLTLVAGNGTPGYSGDGGPAAGAQLHGPSGVAVDASGSVYIADTYNHRIRKVSNGTITTVAGSGIPGFSGDNGPATSAQLNFPAGVALDSTGGLYIADTYNSASARSPMGRSSPWRETGRVVTAATTVRPPAHS